MPKKRRLTIGTLSCAVLAVMLAVLTACGASSSAPSPAASSSASPKASASAPSSAAPSPSSAAPSPSASAKAPSADEQAYQKAQANWAQVVEAARKEGEATIYSVYPPDFNDMFQQEFNKIDPKIQVKLIRIIGAAALERIRAEQSTKQYVGNAYVGGTVRPMAKEGLGQTAELPAALEPGVKWLIDPLLDKPLETVIHSFNKFVLIYNTNLVPAGQEPQTWTDLADPKWKNKVSMWDPRISGIGQMLLSLLYLDPDHGPDVARKILENVQAATNSTETAQLVAKGELPIGLTTWGSYLTVKDAPVKLISPKDGAAGGPSLGLMLKNAPQPNTTRLYLNWLLEKDAQKIFGKGYATIRPDVQAEAKDAQIAGEKFLRGVPQTADFELTKMAEPPKVIVQWLAEMGR